MKESLGKCVMRTGGLVIGCLATGMAFSSDAFAIYGQTFKQVFRYSQTEVETIMSMAMLGLVSAWPSSVLLRALGARWLTLVSLLITSGGSCMVALACHYHTTFYDKSYLMAFFFMAIGIGNGMMYITATSVNMSNFEGSRWLGLISGLIHAVKSVVLGGLLIAFRWLQHSRTALNQDLNSGKVQMGEVQVLLEYMIVQSALYAGINGLGIFFYGDYKICTTQTYEQLDELPTAQDAIKDAETKASERKPIMSTPAKYVHKYDSTLGSSTNNSDCDTASDLNLDDKEILMGKATKATSANMPTDKTGVAYWTVHLMKDPYFHALLWPCVCIMGFRMSYLNNVSIIFFSMRISAASGGAVFILIPVVGALSKPAIGVVTDRLLVDRNERRIVPRSVIFLVSAVILNIFCLLDIGLLDNIVVISGTMAMAQVASSCMQTLGPPILIEYFGSKAFSTGWGLITVGFTLGTVLLQFVLGSFYDFMAKTAALTGGPTHKQRHCYGITCFLLYFWVNSVLVYLSCVSLVFLTHRLWMKQKSGGDKAERSLQGGDIEKAQASRPSSSEKE